MMLIEHLAAPESEHVAQDSNINMPPHCPKEVMQSRRHVFRGTSFMGQSSAMQLELNLTLSAPSSMLFGSVTLPEKVFPEVVKLEKCKLQEKKKI